MTSDGSSSVMHSTAASSSLAVLGLPYSKQLLNTTDVALRVALEHRKNALLRVLLPCISLGEELAEVQQRGRTRWT